MLFDYTLLCDNKVELEIAYSSSATTNALYYCTVDIASASTTSTVLFDSHLWYLFGISDFAISCHCTVLDGGRNAYNIISIIIRLLKGGMET